ncbi:MAG: UxaA family hydrolase [Hyphomonas sp.]
MTALASRILTLNPADDVGIVLADLARGAETAGNLRARNSIRAGHKIALRAIAKGTPVRKYGQVIGLASQDIQPGDHVHTHNLAFGGQARILPSNYANAPPPQSSTATFMGYARKEGRAGTRNYIGILTSVNCSATVARKIAAAFEHEPMPEGLDGVCAFTHTTGCGTASQSEGVDNLTRTVMGYARHSNFAAVILIGLGCEVNQIDRMLKESGLAESSRLHTFTIQEEGGTLTAIERGKALVRELIAEHAGTQRVPVPASDLMVGLQCGGSDGWSGLTANPSLGAAADLIAAQGGTAILSETPEIYGAESLLLSRAVSADVAAKLIERLDWWEAYAARHGASLNNNPSPGNLEGGLTTILEKSLGAIAKSGTSPLMGIYRYGEPIHQPGFVFMDSPGYDPCSATGQIASGANLIAFTTGRGSVFGSKPAPCLKLASNAKLARHMAEDMDIDCSPVAEGTSTFEMGELIFARMLAIASGGPTRSEALGMGDHEFVPWQIGAWM